jgi:hypothetical protein
LNSNPQNPKTKAIIMADRKGGNIIDSSTIDALIKQGEGSQKARQAAMEKRRKEKEDKKKAEEMKKRLEDTGMSRAHEQELGVAVKLPLFRRYKAKERRRLLRSVRNYKLYTVGLPYAR